jgi:hypothetical protein
MSKSEIKVRCNNGTRFKIVHDKATGYVLYYRNDSKALQSVDGEKIKGEWLYLDSQPMYCDALDLMYEEISQIDAVYGCELD